MSHNTDSTYVQSRCCCCCCLPRAPHTYLLVRDEAEMLKKVARASAASALASMVWRVVWGREAGRHGQAAQARLVKC